MYGQSEPIFTFNRELQWLKDNIFLNRPAEYDFIYSKTLRGLHTQNSQAFLTNIIVTMSTIQLTSSKCYEVIASNSTIGNLDNTTNKFINFCNSQKVLVAVIGPHASLLQSFAATQDDDGNLFSMINLYEKFSPRINFYRNHIKETEDASGYNFNIIWPNQLDNDADIDTFIKKCNLV